MSSASRALADASAAAARALHEDDLRPRPRVLGHQLPYPHRIAGCPRPLGRQAPLYPPPEASVESSRSPTPAHVFDGGASEGSQLQDSLPAAHEPEASLVNAFLPQTPTPAPAVDSPTRGVSGGSGALSGGSVEFRGDATEPSLSSMCKLAKLVVEMARQPPARRFDGPRGFGGCRGPPRLPPQEADELVRLRDEVSRLQTRCKGAERGLANEVQLRRAAEADGVRSTEDFYTIHDANEELRRENEELVTRIRELDITVAEQAHSVQRWKDRCRFSNADCAAAMRYVTQERERMKTGLKVYNAELAKLREYLEEHDRGKVYSPSLRVKALLAENASLRRAISVLRQNSAEHGLNTDALILSTAEFSASYLDWELLGLVTARRGTDTSAFVPADTVVSRAANSRKLTVTVERFLESGLPLLGPKRFGMLNVSLSEAALKDHASPLDFAFLALMYNRKTSVAGVFYRMLNEPLTFELRKLVQGVRISLRTSGHGGLVRMWRRFSDDCYEDNEKIDLCVALWERRHWLQVSALDNAIRKFKDDSDPLDPFTHVILGLWNHLNRMRNNRADLLRQQIDRLWEWCTSAGGRTRTLPTEVLLQRSYLQIFNGGAGMGSRYHRLVPGVAGVGCKTAMEKLLD
ncbi:LOW QUALITY PROTEIN: hypothetical protein PHMEG_00020164 [Phytophthora megakarya]|uniref:Uncharacterized protein n=1 Tax=Phytophthora megakarya TaxID=4795 RepID=A0A225VRA9_9STRA|nr:LOW QUALITY PROTEIN: hypothetical protein PHMEG_00020164 [Phytophthora megakarya]